MASSWMHDMLERVDAMDVAGFVSFFAEDGVFRMANNPPSQGRGNIAAFTAGFFAMLDGISHEVLGTWHDGDQYFLEGNVTYVRKDKKRVSLRFLTRARRVEGKLTEYSAFLDPAPLFAP